MSRARQGEGGGEKERGERDDPVRGTGLQEGIKEKGRGEGLRASEEGVGERRGVVAARDV